MNRDCCHWCWKSCRISRKYFNNSSDYTGKRRRIADIECRYSAKHRRFFKDDWGDWTASGCAVFKNIKSRIGKGRDDGKIAVLGYGTVGSGVVEVLETNKNSIEKRAGEGIEVKYVLDLRDFPGDPVQEKIVHDVDIIIQDKEIDVVVEVMGGIEPAFTFVKSTGSRKECLYFQ